MCLFLIEEKDRLEKRNMQRRKRIVPDKKSHQLNETGTKFPEYSRIADLFFKKIQSVKVNRCSMYFV